LKSFGRRGGLPSSGGTLHQGHGAPAPPQPHACSPSQGRSRWFSQTHRQPSHTGHVIGRPSARHRCAGDGCSFRPDHGYRTPRRMGSASSSWASATAASRRAPTSHISARCNRDGRAMPGSRPRCASTGTRPTRFRSRLAPDRTCRPCPKCVRPASISAIPKAQWSTGCRCASR